MSNTNRLTDDALGQLFLGGRSFSHWLERPVSDDTLRELYEVMKWGPTSVNSCPARILFLRTPEAKQRLVPALSSTNVQKVLSAPVTAIIAFDLRFFDKMPKLWPHNPGYQATLEKSPHLAEVTAFRNSTLQGAYLILAARALGLDCGPMSGFDNGKVDAEFFAETHLRSNFLCNLGYGDRSKLHARGPRLDFEEACQLL